MNRQIPVTENSRITDRRNDAAGFSLLEVLIALTIFAVGLLGIAKIQLSAIKGNADAKRLTKAAVLASDQAEQLMATPYASIDAGSMTCEDGDMVLDWDVTENSAAGYKEIVINCSPAAGRCGSTVKMKLTRAEMP